MERSLESDELCCKSLIIPSLVHEDNTLKLVFSLSLKHWLHFFILNPFGPARPVGQGMRTRRRERLSDVKGQLLPVYSKWLQKGQRNKSSQNVEVKARLPELKSMYQNAFLCLRKLQDRQSRECSKSPTKCPQENQPSTGPKNPSLSGTSSSSTCLTYLLSPQCQVSESAWQVRARRPRAK